MASILQVEQIKGPTSGASANKITVDSDQTLAIDGTIGGTASIPAARLSGTLPAIDGSNLTGIDVPTVGYGAFQVVMTDSQSISELSNTKINFVSEVKDYENLYDTSNKRYQPDVAGLYYFQCRIEHETPYNGEVKLKIYKNGSSYSEEVTESPNTSGYPSATLSALVPMNGTTDYVEMYIYQIMGTSISIYGTAEYGGFGGYLVRAD